MSRRDPFGTREGSGAIHRTIYNSRVNSATTFYAFNLRTSALICVRIFMSFLVLFETWCLGGEVFN